MSYGPRLMGNARSRYDGPQPPNAFSFGVGNAGERGLISVEDRGARGPENLEGLMKQAYSMGVSKGPQDFELDQGFLVENEDFPDVFDMPNFNEVFIARVNEKNNWISQVMPAKQTNKLDVGGDILIFNHTQPERLPEEAVPNYMTHQRENWRDSIVRFGKGITMEKNFYMTLYGRMMFYFQLEQMNNAIMMHQAHSCLCALYYDEREYIKKRSDRMRDSANRLGDGCSVTQLLKEAFKNFGILNRDPTQLQERVAEWTRTFSFENENKTPSRIIFPEGCSWMWKYANLGSYAQTGYKLGEQPNIQQMATNGLKYNESWASRLDDGRLNHDPSYSERTIGSFFIINRSCYNGNKFETEATNVELFNESQDQFNLFKLETNLKYTGVWYNYDQCDANNASKEPSILSNIGVAYMNGCTNYWDLYKRQAPRRELDNICNKILEQPLFIEQIVERINENNLLYSENSLSGNVDPLKSEMREKLAKILPNMYVSKSSRESNNTDKLPQANLAARANNNSMNYNSSDWLNQMSGRYNITMTNQLKDLYSQIQRSKYSDIILQEWETITDENNGQGFYESGKELYVHILLNMTIKRAIQNKVTPSSGVEKYLMNQDLSQVDQVWLDGLSELDSVQENELQFLEMDSLNLLTNDDIRTINYPSLLLPMSTQNVVLFDQDDVRFMGDQDWNKRIFTKPKSSESKNLWNSSLRMAHLYHSIEVSLIYACVTKKIPYKNTMVRNTKPHDKLLDWDKQLKNVRGSNLKVADYQSNYSDKVNAIRQFIRNPTQKGYDTLSDTLQQSKTSGRVRNYPTFNVLERMNKLSLVDENNQVTQLAKFQTDFHGVIQDAAGTRPVKPAAWVIKAFEELKEPMKEYFMDKLNEYYEFKGSFELNKFENFVTNLSRNLILLQAITPSVRFTNTPLENISNEVLIQAYIDRTIAFAIINLDETIVALEKDAKDVFFNLSFKEEAKREQIRTKFSVILNDVVVHANNLYSSLSFNITKQFSNYRAGISTLKKDNSGYESVATDFVKGLNWYTEKNANISIETLKRESIKLVSYVYAFFKLGKYNSDLNDFNQIYENTEIANSVPDLRQMKSQSIAAMMLAMVSVGMIKATSNVPKLIVKEAMQQLKSSSYVVSKLGPWGADENKIALVLGKWLEQGKPANPTQPMTIADNYQISDQDKTAQVNTWNVVPANLARVEELNKEVALNKTDIATLLSLLTTQDAWYAKRTFEYGIPPPIGGMGFRPHATYELGTVLLVIDGIGNLYFMPPSISAGEDHRTMMMHMTFAMYYKGLLNSGRGLVRIPDVYCRAYLGGNGLQVWDPLDINDTTAYRTPAHGADTTHDVFFIPIDYFSEYTNNVMDLTGEFPMEVKATEKEVQECNYSVAKVLSSIWGWKNENCLKEDTYQNRRDFVPRFNTLMMQDHVGRWDGTKYTNIIKNAGAWGPRIYEGCSRDRCGGRLTPEFPSIMV